MNPQVQRLEELLVRIERNRHSPRRHGVANMSAIATEQAVAGGEVSLKPPVTPTARESKHPTEQVPTPSKIEVPQAIAPQPIKKAEAVQPMAIVPAAAALPVHAVAKVVSEVPKISEPTFGQLLRRSLSLRPS